MTSDSLRVGQVISDVIKHNDRVAAARYMEQSANAKIGPAGAWDDPMLMLGVVNLPTSFDIKMDPMTMRMIGLSQNIPYAGQKGLQRQAAEAEASAAAEQTHFTEIDLATTARIAFSDLYYRLQIVNDLTSQYELLDQVVSSTRARVTANQAGQEDLLAAQAELWRMQSQLIMAESDVQEARWNLNSLRGLNPTDSLPPLAAPTAETIPMTPDEWLATAHTTYPPLLQLQHQAQSYALSSEASRRMQWPMLGLSANYGIRSDMGTMKQDNMVGFQATLSLPIFSGHQQGKMALSMDAMKNSSNVEAAQMWREIEAKLRALHLHALHYSQSVQLYRERIVPTDQDAYRGALAHYVANRTSLTTVLSYATSIYRDRLESERLQNELTKTLAEIGKYVTDPAQWSQNTTEHNTLR
ncbi:MAG TPA: TolC family protein [Candidatus Acidoferrum sp.]|nr:TolC family protein [Candidatus Acidoferrum sp.]